MDIILKNLKPCYMSESEIAGSDIYLQPEIRFTQGRKYMICAKSGHGKSSLLNFIYGANSHYDGAILFSDDDGERHASHAMRVDTLAYMFQDLCLFPELTALENVQLKNRLTNHKSDNEIEQMLDSLLPPGKKHQPLRTLSLGQRQRVAAVRTVCQPFKFMLLDEPFSHIDSDNARRVAALLANEALRQQAAIIVTALDPVDYFDFDTVMNL